MNYDISFIGLGKLGLPLATNFAKRGKKVVGIDLNENLLRTLNNDNAPWIEEGLQDNITKSSDNIIYTNSYSKVSESEFSIILVNTPSKEKDGSFSNEYVISSLTSICNELVSSGKPSHNFILSSTVMPGSIYGEFIPLIESITGWKIGIEFNFAYVPDFVAIGSVIRNFHLPDFVLIGSNSREYGDEVFLLYARQLQNTPPTSFVNLKEGELAKVALNAYITTKISFANYLGILAEKLDPEINVDNITEAIGQDKRIGSLYLKAGAPYGGTCFPRDTWAFMQVSNKVGMFAEQMAANEKINNQTLDNIVSKIGDSEKIGLIGLGFKPGTSVVTEGLVEKLIKLNILDSKEVFVHDSFYQSYENLGYSIFNWINDIEDLYNKVDTVILCNGDKSYDLSNLPSNLKVIDPWRIN